MKRTRRPGPVARTFRWFGNTVESASRPSRQKLKSHVSQLRESAIEPLPHVERMPVQLRELDWQNEPNGALDPAATVRRLSGIGLNADQHNELGCAYALLAWKLSNDRYWLAAIDELQAAAGAANPIGERARANLERVAAVSNLPVGRATNG